MKKINVGDHIRFLNAVGGGVVKGFLNKNVAMVEDETGFDVPVLVSECILVETESDKKASASVPDSKPQDSSPAVPEIVPSTDIPTETKEGEKITTCLAFLPMEPKSLSNSAFECYFVNDSNYYLFVNYMSRENNSWVSRFNGLIEPNMQIFIEEFDKSQLNEIEKVCIQFVAFKHQKPYGFKTPCSVELRIDTVKFYKLHTFSDNDYFDEDALIYYITRQDVPERELLVSAKDLAEAMQQKQQAEQRPRIRPVKKREQNKPLEIDLHINELLDTTAGMSNKEMLDYQIQTFNSTMQDNLKKKGQKIVFIHGKGDGVLKKAILDELKAKYKSCYVQDASFQEYGYGATMVTIK